MDVGTFVPTGYNSNTVINSCMLSVDYTTTSKYTGTNAVQYSFNGAKWYNTTIVPVANQNGAVSHLQPVLPEPWSKQLHEHS